MEEKLSQFKKNIIAWYPIQKEDSVLEIGKIPEITEELKKKSSKVVSIELEDSHILNEKFDYITIIGDFSKEFDKKLELAKEYIKQDGKILIALDNQFGLKNWNTSQDLKKDISENLLREKFKDLEINNSKFYYVLPNYKFANLIYSEDYNLTVEDITRNFAVYNDEDIVNLNENEVYKSLLKEDKKFINKFMNSFFVELSAEKIDTDIKYVTYTNYRKPEYRVMTLIGDRKVYKKAADEKAIPHIKSIENNLKKINEIGLKTIEKFNNNVLESEFINTPRFDVELSNSKSLEEFIEKFEPLKKVLYENAISYEEIGKQNLRQMIGEYDENKLKKLKFLKEGFIDLIPKNCFLVNGILNIFDQEWAQACIPVEYIIYRAIVNLEDDINKFSKENLFTKLEVIDYTDLFEKLEETFRDEIIDEGIYEIFLKTNPNIEDLKNTINHYKNLLSQSDNKVNTLEEEIDLKQNHVSNLEENIEIAKKEITKLDEQNSNLEKHINDKNTQINNLGEQINDKDNHIDNLGIHINNLETQVNDYSNQLQIIASSLSWKITKPLRYASWILNFKSKAKLVDRIFPPGSKMRIKYDKKKTVRDYEKKINSYHKFTDEETVEYWKEIEHREQNIKETGKEETDYEIWARLNKLTEEELDEQRKTKFKIRPKISIAIPLYNTPVDFFRELLFNLCRQTYRNWELCLVDGSTEKLTEIEKMCKDKRIKYKFLNGNKGIAGNTNEALSMATGDYISLLDHDDLLPVNALYEIVKCINENPDVDFIYTDEDKFTNIDEVRFEPYFKPDFSPDTLRANNYICHYSVFSKRIIEKIGGFNTEFDGAQDYDMILRATENANKIVHISKILYHWRVHKASTAMAGAAKPYAFESGIKAIDAHLNRIGLKGKSKHGITLGTYAIDYELQGNPKISIVIPSKDGKEILEVCINSILEKTTYKNYELIIVENNSETKEIFEYYKEIEKNEKIKVVKYPNKGFNYSAIINFGVRNSEGEYIVQLNNDTELITPDWLEKMLGFAQRENVGAVGVKMYYPDYTLQHGGVIFGLGGIAGHAFKNLLKDQYGYFSRVAMVQNLTAVTAACIMTKKEIYEEVGFMNEELAVAFNDIDFCLKIRKTEKLIVYNPFVEFLHYESKTRGYEDTVEKQKRFKGEIDKFNELWSEELEKGDPYYNKNLRLDNDQYAIKTEKVI